MATTKEIRDSSRKLNKRGRRRSKKEKMNINGNVIKVTFVAWNKINGIEEGDRWIMILGVPNFNRTRATHTMGKHEEWRDFLMTYHTFLILVPSMGNGIATSGSSILCSCVRFIHIYLQLRITISWTRPPC